MVEKLAQEETGTIGETGGTRTRRNQNMDEKKLAQRQGETDMRTRTNKTRRQGETGRRTMRNQKQKKPL